MKQIKAILMLLAAMLIMASCTSGSDSETTLYGEAAITAFSVSKAVKYTTTESSDGTITTKKSTYTATSYKFVIDQLKHEIYNPDSLPAGTDPSRILCSISSFHNGIILIKDKTEADTYYYYSSTDSIDFSTPRTFRIVSSDGNGITDYTVKVNVHGEEADKFIWSNVYYIDYFAEMKGLKAFYKGGNFYIFGNHEGKTTVVMTPDGSAYDYEHSKQAFSADAWKNTALIGGDFYVFDDNKLYMSDDDAVNWKTIEYVSPKPIKQLIGASTFELYALSTDNKLLVSEAGFHDDGTYEAPGTTWLEENYDETTEPLPSEDLAMVCYPVYMADNSEQVLLVGNAEPYNSDHDYAYIWRKIIDFDYDLSWGQWNYMDRGNATLYNMPRVKDLNLLYYGQSIIAFYSSTIDDMDDSTLPKYSTMLQSRDNGITWKTSSSYTMPTKNFEPTMVSGVVDDKNNIWLFCAGGEGNVIKGYLPRVVWENK